MLETGGSGRYSVGSGKIHSLAFVTANARSVYSAIIYGGPPVAKAFH